jgi:shikimate kinase
MYDAPVTGVYLVGLRGTGKTTLGRRLAEEMAMDFVDLDEVVEERAGKPAGEVIDSEGVEAFRAAEAEALESMLGDIEDGGAVLALGGGAAESPRVEDVLYGLRGLGWRGVWLVVHPNELVRRLRRSGVRRPRLCGRSVEEEIRVLASRRASLFARLSDVRFDNTDEDVDRQATALLEVLGPLRDPPGAEI